MLTRRRFIGTTLVAGAALTISAQQARPQPASKRTIVDAQVHFWKASSPDWPWDPGVRPLSSVAQNTSYSPLILRFGVCGPSPQETASVRSRR